MTFAQYMAAQARGGFSTAPQLRPATAANLAFPGKEDTRRAIDRAKKMGRVVTPDDMKVATSPESQAAARQGVLNVSRLPLGRISGKTSDIARP